MTANVLLCMSPIHRSINYSFKLLVNKSFYNTFRQFLSYKLFDLREREKSKTMTIYTMTFTVREA
jgi:hypothetical protein